MKKLWGIFLIFQSLILSCTHKPENANLSRNEIQNEVGIVREVASDESEAKIELQKSADQPAMTLDQELPILVYITYKDSGFPKREDISAEKWNGQIDKGFSSGTREQYLKQMFYANTRNASLKGLRHNACFEGDAHVVAEKFFGQESAEIRNISTGRADTKASEDGRMLRVSFEHLGESERLGAASFRMQHCSSGKSAYGEYLGEKLPAKNYTAFKKVSRGIASDDGSKGLTELNKAFTPKVHDKNFGFRIIDTTADPVVKRRFVLKADYENAFQAPDERPWQGLDIKNPTEALKIAVLAQAHFYQGMFDKKTNPDDFFVAQENKTRFWCQVPWMHVGPSGREAIHGLTRERDMKASTQIPVFFNAPAGSNWGVSYFNSTGCKSLFEIFGSATNPKEEPDFTKSNFDNGTMIVKILFTTSAMKNLASAFTWNANVSEPGSNARRIKPVKHIQMDMAIKDVDLKGSSSDVANWVMLGFYFDPNYDYDRDVKPILKMENPLKKIANLPAGLLKMRPMGVQSGLDAPSEQKGVGPIVVGPKNKSETSSDTKAADTIIFEGARTNGVEGRLNGPADNPKSSCMGCHGTAGTNVSMVPGFLNNNQYAPFKTKSNLDFNQQLSMSRSYWQTESGN